jgi:crotonobetainyl-CoA:carnitine CoA-transferase CaiB-like acyl-CoA transferase
LALARGSVFKRTGKGQAVEVSMAESTLMVNDLTFAGLLGKQPTVGFRAAQNWSAIYKLRDGRAVSVIIDGTTDDGFEVWVKATGREDCRTDPRFATQAEQVRQRADYEAGIGEWVANSSTAPKSWKEASACPPSSLRRGPCLSWRRPNGPPNTAHSSMSISAEGTQ